MKIEQREIKITKAVFVAEDGKEFYDRDDCLEYEINKKQDTSNIFFNDRFERCGYDECMYVKLDNDEQVRLFMEIYEYHGMCTEGIDGPGLYMYTESYRNDSWTNISKAVDILRLKISEDQ